jgi:hypothetical protein
VEAYAWQDIPGHCATPYDETLRPIGSVAAAVALARSLVYFFLPPADGFAVPVVSNTLPKRGFRHIPAGAVRFFLGALFPRCFNLHASLANV